MLEPYAVKVASTVLKGLGVGNDLRLLDLIFVFLLSTAKAAESIIYHTDFGAGIWRMNSDGTGQTQLINHGGFAEYSPNGSKIAFGDFYNNGVWIMNADGTGPTQLTTTGGTPSWSPDSSKIVYFVGDTIGANRRIWIMNADGTGALKLSDNPGSFPKWSPNGNKIIYHGESNNGIWLINSDGTGEIQLYSDGGYPAWSPDGQKIAYISLFDWTVWIMNSDGTGHIKLNSSGGIDATWSSDGQMIAYSNSTSGIWVINIDGTNNRQINSEGLAPDWAFSSGPTQVTSCREISSPGEYVLTTDIINSINDTCFSITSNDVIFDGNGHTIDGMEVIDSEGISIYNSNVTIKNLKVTDWWNGIFLNRFSSNNNLINNNISNSIRGIILSDSSFNTLDGNSLSSLNLSGSNTVGIVLQNSNDNIISNNTVSFQSWGIFMSSSDNNSLTGNNISECWDNGILLTDSSNMTLKQNNITNNEIGIFVEGVEKNHFNNSIDITNEINGKPVYYLFDKKNVVLDGINAGHLTLAYSANITIKNSNVIDGDGIRLMYSSNNGLSNNIISNNQYGIYLGFSGKNTFTDNEANNNRDGLFFSGNNISHFDNNIDITNKVNGKPVYYIFNQKNIVLESIDAGHLTLAYSSNNIIKNSNFNDGDGIRLLYSSNNNLSINNASNNDIGINLGWSNNNTLKENNALNNDRIGLNFEYSNDNSLISNNPSYNHFGLIFYYSDNNTLKDNNILNNDYVGFESDHSSYNNLSHNNISKNGYGFYGKGIELWNSSNHTLINNNISDNYIGMRLGGFSSNNCSFYNNYFNNINNIFFNDPTYDIKWNTSKTNGTNIIGGPNLGGNFWAYPNGTGFSQTCLDVGRDGICDSAYILNTNNIDYLPLSAAVQSGPTQVTSCRAISSPGEYVLTADIINSTNSTCINITSSNVVFDGNGHIISGIKTNYTNGVYVYNSKNVTVENLKVINWYYGINYNYVTSGSIARNNASSNIRNGFHLISSANIILTDNIADLNGWDTCMGTCETTPFIWSGIDISYSNNNTLSGNTANSNSYAGIYLFGSHNNTLIVNSAHSNYYAGISLWYSINNTLIRNDATSNNFCGINLLHFSNNNSLIDNNASADMWDFMSIFDSVNNKIISLNITPVISFIGNNVEIKSSSSPGSDPPGYRNIGKYIKINNISFDSWLFLNVSYSNTDVTGQDENTLRMWKYNGSWSQVSGTNNVNTLQNYVFANITSFSIFAPMAELPPSGPPNITIATPGSPVTTEERASQTFNITINQSVNVTWLINGSIVKDTEKNVLTASYTNTSGVYGTWNVSAMVINANGSDMQTWSWMVLPPITIIDLSPGNNSENRNGTVNVKVTLNRPGTSRLIWNEIDEYMEGGGTFYYRIKTGLLSGKYSFRVYANDSIGNSDTSETRIIIINRSKDILLPIDSKTGNLSLDFQENAPSDKVTLKISNNTNTSVDLISIDSHAYIEPDARDAMESGNKFAGEILELDPPGATFYPDVQLIFNYTDPQLTQNGITDESKLTISYYNILARKWENLKITKRDPVNNYIIGNTSHFSLFALAADLTPPPGVTDLKNTSFGRDYIYWTWKDPIDASFNHTSIWIDGTFKGNVSKGVQFYNATGFEPNTSHTINVTTVDAFGNSNQTAVTNTSRTALSESIYITIITPENNSENTDGSITIKVKLDRNGIARLNWKGLYEPMNGSGMNFSSNKPGVLSGNFSFWIYANDSTTSAVSETRTIRVNRTIESKFEIGKSGNTTDDYSITLPSNNTTVTLYNNTNISVIDKTGQLIDCGSEKNISVDSLDIFSYEISSRLKEYRFAGENFTVEPVCGKTIQDARIRFIPDAQIRINYTVEELTALNVKVTDFMVKYYDEVNQTWSDLNITYRGDTYIIVNVSHFCSIAKIVPTIAQMIVMQAGSSSVEPGTQGVISAEPADNIVDYETHSNNLVADKSIIYHYVKVEEGIYEIAVVSNKNESNVLIRVEYLKNRSKMVKEQAPEFTHYYTNIWSGSKNIKESVIRFKEENSWIDSNKLTQVKMLRFEGGQWTDPGTIQISKDEKYTYFETKTNGFSSFAIIGLKPEPTPTETEAVTPSPTISVTPPPNGGKPNWDIILKVFAVFLIIVVLVVTISSLKGKSKLESIPKEPFMVKAPAEYGEKYYEHLFEQYKQYVDIVEKLNQSHRSVDTGYLILASFFGVLSGLESLAKQQIWPFLVPFTGLLISIKWMALTYKYRQLNSAKNNLIYELESQLPAALYASEWKNAWEGRTRSYSVIEFIEQVVPWIFAGIFFIYIIVRLNLM